MAEVAEIQVKAREAQILANELDGTASAFREATLKAERLGIMLFMALPETMIEGIEADINELIGDDDG